MFYENFQIKIAANLKNSGLNDILMENEKASVLARIPIFVQKEPEDVLF